MQVTIGPRLKGQLLKFGGIKINIAIGSRKSREFGCIVGPMMLFVVKFCGNDGYLKSRFEGRKHLRNNCLAKVGCQTSPGEKEQA